MGAPDDSWSPHTSTSWSSSLTSPPPSCPNPPSYTPHPVTACSQVTRDQSENCHVAGQNPHGSQGVTIILKCPRVSALHTCISVYLIIMGSLGVVISSLWVISHIYVLSHTSDNSLLEQRYVDVCIGISFLVSQTCLISGARGHRISHVLAFLILSCLVILLYWIWWACLYYSRSDTEASKELWDTLSILSLVYVASLLAPTLPFYKYLEEKQNRSPLDNDGDKTASEGIKIQ